MNMDVQKGLRKRKLTSFFTMTYGHPPKLNPIRYDSSAFCSSTIRNGSPERLNFSAKFQRFIRGINAKAPEVGLNVGSFKESEGTREYSDARYSSACKRVERENL